MGRREAAKIRRQIEACDVATLRNIVGGVCDALWPAGDAGHEWSADTTDDVARALQRGGVGPWADPPEARPAGRVTGR